MNLKKLFLSSIIGAVILAVIIQASNIAEVSQRIVNASPEWLVLSIGTFSGAYLLRAYRWKIILGGSRRFSNLFYIGQIGYLISNILPFQLGEVMRSVLLKEKEQVKMGYGLASIVVERVMDVLVLLILGVSILILLPLKQSAATLLFGTTLTFGIIAAGFIALLVIFVLRRDRVTSVVNLVNRIPYLNRYSRTAEATMSDTAESIKVISAKRAFLLASFGMTFAIWIVNFVATYWLFIATNFTIDPIDVFLATVAIALLMSLPSPPSYAGTLEGFWIMTFFALGYSQYEQILSVSILAHILMIGITTILGIVGIASLKLSFSYILSEEPSKPAMPGRLLAKIYYASRKNKTLFAIVRGLHDASWMLFGRILAKFKSETKLEEFRFMIRRFNWPDCASSMESYEQWEKYVSITQGCTALDIGAHIGRHSLLLAKKVGPRGKVISIEPDPDNFELLSTNIQINSIQNVTPLKVAVWDKKVNLELHRSPQSSLHYLTECSASTYGSSIISATTVDDILSELNIGQVGFMKIDVEGAEFKVLQGSLRTLRESSPDLIVEIHKGEEGLNECNKFLKDLGYKINVISSRREDALPTHDIYHIYATKKSQTLNLGIEQNG